MGIFMLIGLIYIFLVLFSSYPPTKSPQHTLEFMTISILRKFTFMTLNIANYATIIKHLIFWV